MGRIFEKRKDRMFARWSKNAKAFTKVGKEIAVAVKLGGAEPASNPRLRMAIQTARSLNMPKDRIEAAVHRASSKDSSNLQEVIYEGYAPHGIAILIITATDNATRTVANVRSILSHSGGTMATSGALSYLFDKKGVFSLGMPSGDLEEFELEMMDHGLDDLFESEDGLLMYSTFEGFGGLQKVLEDKKVDLKSAAIQYFPKNTVALEAAQQKEVEEIIAELDEDDDVQYVYHNMRME